MTGFARYRRVLTAPDVAPAFAAALLARSPIGFYGLAFVLLFKHETGSYAIAGAVAAAFVAGAGVGSPLQGRLIDRLGQRRVLLPTATVHSGLLAVLVGITLSGAPTGLLVTVAALSGLAIPPMSSVMRALWPDLLGREPALVTAAFALDAVAIELIFVTGPLVVAALVALFSPQVAVLAGCGLVLAGTGWFVSTPPSRGWRPEMHEERHGIFGALRSPGLRTLVVCTLPLGFCFGAVEVALPAFCDEHAQRELAGVLLAVWSAASAAGGLIYGAREHGRGLGARYVGFAALLPLGYLPLAFAPSFAVMALLLIPAGLCIAPMLTASNQLAGEVAPPGTTTEAYTWPVTALTVGIGAGNLVAGTLAENPGWEAAFVAAAGAALLGAALAYGRRGTLRSTA